MPIRLFIALLFISLFWAAPAQADVVADCKAQTDEAAVADCLEQAFQTSERRLTQAHGALSRALEKIDGLIMPSIDANTKFRAAHSDWTTYRIRNCTFLTAVEDWAGNGGRDVLECLIVETDRRSSLYFRMADLLAAKYLE